MSKNKKPKKANTETETTGVTPPIRRFTDGEFNADLQIPEEPDVPPPQLYSITQDALYLLALFAEQLLDVRPEAREWSQDGSQLVEWQRWMRLDELEKSLRDQAERLWVLGSGAAQDKSRWSICQTEYEADRNRGQPWYYLFQEFHAQADLFDTLVAVQQQKIDATIGKRIVRVRGFCGNNAIDCFRKQLVDLKFRLDQQHGEGIPSGSDLLAMLQEWEMEIVSEGTVPAVPAIAADSSTPLPVRPSCT